jgi:hypothetical protein
MLTTSCRLDQLYSLFSSRQWSECLDMCSSIQISDLDSDQTCLFFMLYLRTILSLKSPKNSNVWNLVQTHYKSISQIPIQLSIVQVHVLLSLNSPREASNLCHSLYCVSHAAEILELHVFSVIIPHSLMSQSEIFNFLNQKSREYQVNVEKYKIRVQSDEPLTSAPVSLVSSWTKKLLKLINRSDLVPLRNGSIIIFVLILLRYMRYKYKTV